VGRSGHYTGNNDIKKDTIMTLPASKAVRPIQSTPTTSVVAYWDDDGVFQIQEWPLVNGVVAGVNWRLQLSADDAALLLMILARVPDEIWEKAAKKLRDLEG
jgi:hypothetical protein